MKICVKEISDILSETKFFSCCIVWKVIVVLRANKNICKFPMNATGTVTKKLTLSFFDVLEVTCCCKNIRIELHFLFVLGNKKTWVACKSLRSASQDVHVTRVHSFPNANKKVYISP